MTTICKWVFPLFLQTLILLSKKSFWISLAYCSISFCRHKLLGCCNEMDQIGHRRKFHDLRKLCCWRSQSDGKILVAIINYDEPYQLIPRCLEFQKNQNWCLSPKKLLDLKGSRLINYFHTFFTCAVLTIQIFYIYLIKIWLQMSWWIYNQTIKT